MYLISKLLEDTRSLVQLCPPQLVRAIHLRKGRDPAETCRVAVVVRDHDGWIKRLKVEDKKGALIESGSRLPVDESMISIERHETLEIFL